MNKTDECILSTTLGLYKLGAIDERKMNEIKALVAPIPEYPAEKVLKVRRKSNLSQAALASLLNINKSTVQSWEQGKRPVKGPSRTLLYVLEKNGIEAFI